MEEYQTKIDAEKECEEVRRIFADAGNGQIGRIERLRDLEESETRTIRAYHKRTIYCVEDIIQRAREESKSLGEELRVLSDFKAEREYDAMREKKVYMAVIEALTGYEEEMLELDTEDKTIKTGVRLINSFGKTVVKDENGAALKDGLKDLTVGRGLRRIIEDEYTRIRRGSQRTIYSIKDVIERAKEELTSFDEYLKRGDKKDRWKKEELEKRLRVCEGIIRDLVG